MVLSHVHGSSGFPRSCRQPDDDVFTLQWPPDHLLLVGVQAKICHRTPAQQHRDRCCVNRAANETSDCQFVYLQNYLPVKLGASTRRLLVSPKCTRGEQLGLLNVRSAGWRRNENESRNLCEEAPPPCRGRLWRSDSLSLVQRQDLITIQRIHLNFYKRTAQHRMRMTSSSNGSYSLSVYLLP